MKGLKCFIVTTELLILTLGIIGCSSNEVYESNSVEKTDNSVVEDTMNEIGNTILESLVSESNYGYAIIKLPNGEVVEGKISSFTDRKESRQADIEIDGKIYTVSYENFVIVKEKDDE